MTHLAGRRVVITRAVHQADELAGLLRQRGAEPLLYPCLDIVPPLDTAPIDAALRHLADYDWLIFTSGNAVRMVGEYLAKDQPQPALGLIPSPSPSPFPIAMGQGNGSDIGPTPLPNALGRGWGWGATLHHLKIAAVGPATAKAVYEYLGMTVQHIPAHFQAEALAQVIPICPGDKILLPQADIAESGLMEALTARGAIVTPLTIYRTVMGSGGIDLVEALRGGAVDVITFTSGSTVRNCLARLAAEGGHTADLCQITLACMGSATAQVAQKQGLVVAVRPAVHTLAALVNSLEDYFYAC